MHTPTSPPVTPSIDSWACSPSRSRRCSSRTRPQPRPEQACCWMRRKTRSRILLAENRVPIRLPRMIEKRAFTSAVTLTLPPLLTDHPMLTVKLSFDSGRCWRPWAAAGQVTDQGRRAPVARSGSTLDAPDASRPARASRRQPHSRQAPGLLTYSYATETARRGGPEKFGDGSVPGLLEGGGTTTQRPRGASWSPGRMAAIRTWHRGSKTKSKPGRSPPRLKTQSSNRPGASK